MLSVNALLYRRNGTTFILIDLLILRENDLTLASNTNQRSQNEIRVLIKSAHAICHTDLDLKLITIDTRYYIIYRLYIQSIRNF